MWNCKHMKRPCGESAPLCTRADSVVHVVRLEAPPRLLRGRLHAARVAPGAGAEGLRAERGLEREEVLLAVRRAARGDVRDLMGADGGAVQIGVLRPIFQVCTTA